MLRVDCDPYKLYLLKRIRKGVTNVKKLFDEVKLQGYGGCYLTLLRYIKKEIPQYPNKRLTSRYNIFNRKPSSFSKPYKPAIRFETQPGQQGQVDWTYFGNIIVNRRKERLYCFVYILCYSRALYIEFTTKQNLIVFETCHINAFKKLGIPQEIVYDNTKTVVIKNKKLEDGTREIVYNSQFLDFSKYYGFQIKASPPYWPRNKGKVESSINYIKNHLKQDVNHRKNLNSLESLNNYASDWVEKTANKRLHGTTHEKPTDRLSREKQYLRFTNTIPDYYVSPLLARFVTKDQFVHYNENFYSVPPEYARKKVFIKEVHEQGIAFVKIYYQGALIWQHHLATSKYSYVEDESHFKKSISKLEDSDKIIKSKRGWKNIAQIPARPLEYYNSLIPKI